MPRSKARGANWRDETVFILLLFFLGLPAVGHFELGLDVLNFAVLLLQETTQVLKQVQSWFSMGHLKDSGRRPAKADRIIG